jgi:Tfp pilus assembly protein PilN
METVLGLEFTEEKIRILEIGLSEKKLELLCLNIVDLPSVNLREGVIVEPKLLAERISKFLKENNISTKKAIALINHAYTIAKIIRLPANLSDAQIRLNVEAELNQYQAFAGREMVVDFKKLEEISEEGIKKVNVLFAATHKALSESYLKTLELAGLDLIGIDVPILSILRNLDEVDFKSSSLEVTLLMVIGQKYLEMCVIKGNRPRFLHSVEIEIYDLEKDKAGFIERLLSVIKLVVNFYQVRFVQGEPISRIIINPLDSAYKQVHTLLQEKLPQIPIQLSNPLGRVLADKEKFADTEALRFGFSGLIGAALRLEDKALPFNLNLLLEQRTQRQYRLTQTYLLFVSLVFILGIMVFSLIWIVLKINILQSKATYFNAQIEQPPQGLNKVLLVKEKNNILQKEIEEAALIINNVRGALYFKNISKAMVLVPQDLWLTEINLQEADKNLILSGESKTEKSIFDYVSLLSGSGYFGGVELVSSKGGSEAINFTIRCLLK